MSLEKFKRASTLDLSDLHFGIKSEDGEYDHKHLHLLHNSLDFMVTLLAFKVTGHCDFSLVHYKAKPLDLMIECFRAAVTGAGLKLQDDVHVN